MSKYTSPTPEELQEYEVKTKKLYELIMDLMTLSNKHIPKQNKAKVCLWKNYYTIMDLQYKLEDCFWNDLEEHTVNPLKFATSTPLEFKKDIQ